MRIAIYGAGAMGTVLGAYISRAGYDIDLINRNKEHVAALKERGATITGTTHFTQKVNAILPEKMTGKYDVILLMTKQKNNREIVKYLKDYLHSNSLVCTMQNGIPEPLIASIIGGQRVAGATMSWGATMHGNGIAELTSEPTRDSLTFSIGKFGTVNEELFNVTVELLKIMGDVKIESNFMGARWAKLTVNAAFSGLSVITGETFGYCSTNKVAKRIALTIIKESIEVAKRASIKIEPIQGHNIIRLMDYNNWVKKQVSLNIIPIAMRKHKNIRSGMLRDLKLGRETEIDNINGIICQYGKQYQIKTPANQLIVDITKEIEKGKRSSSIANLEAFKNLL